MQPPVLLAILVGPLLLIVWQRLLGAKTSQEYEYLEAADWNVFNIVAFLAPEKALVFSRLLVFLLRSSLDLST